MLRLRRPHEWEGCPSFIIQHIEASVGIPSCLWEFVKVYILTVQPNDIPPCWLCDL